MFKEIFLMFVMAAMLTGCDKDPKPEEDPNVPIQLVTKIAYDDGSYHTFEYDNKNRLTKIIRSESTITISYDSKGEVASLKFDYSQYQYPGYVITKFYTRTGNRIDMCIDIDCDGKCDESGILIFYFEVNAQNELVKLVDEDIDRTRMDIYTYTGGNLTKDSWEFAWEFDNETTHGDYVYTYDDKKSPFHDCATPSWFKCHLLGAACKNNMLTKTTTSRIGKQEAKYTYTYDDGGYALTREYVSQDVNGSERNKTEIYTYITR